MWCSSIRSWPGENGNRRSDPQDAAEYYAVRPGVPPSYLFRVAIPEQQVPRVLVPTGNRLAELTVRHEHSLTNPHLLRNAADGRHEL
jgi:hypothetical protein